MMSLLFESSVRALLIAGAVAIVLRGLRITSARARHSAWCAVLAAMLLLPAFCAWGPEVPLRVLPRSNDAPVAIPWTGIASTPSEPTAIPPAPVRSLPAPAPAHSWPSLPWIAYLLIAGIMLIRFIYGAARTASIRKRALAGDGFLTSPDCACPIVLGWWTPAILLPSAWTSWPKSEVDAVLAHERAHLRRRDPLVQAIAALNRCIFWFHPLAWWLERRLSTLSEEACDAEVIVSGTDPRDYAEYLLRQARAVARAGARIPLTGPAIGGGALAHRIHRLLDDPPAPAVRPSRAVLATTLCALGIAAFAACRLDRTENAAAGQPTMHDLAARRAASRMENQERQKAILDRARSLTGAEAQQLFARLKDNPQDADSYWTLVRYYEFQVDVQGLDALKLWYIEHQPSGKLWGSGIDPNADPAGYAKGKALWLSHLKQPGASADIYQRAASFLEGGDKSVAGTILQAGRKAFPDDSRWPHVLGRHYAQVLLNGARAQETESSYARTIREELAASRDADLLAHTAQWLLLWSSRDARRPDPAALQLARTYLDRALSIQPESEAVRSVKLLQTEVESGSRLEQLRKMPPAALAAAPAADRMMLALFQMREAAIRQNFTDAESNARDLLDLAARNPNDQFYGDALFEANIVLGKAALHRNDRKAAARYLLAAAETPGSGRVRRGEFDMNLPRALVDWGERRAVIEFFQRMAPKTARTQQFQEWSTELARGINPDLLPTFSAPNCTHDPC